MCAPRGPPTSLSQLQLSTEALLRKCKEFSKIVTATSQSLWTLVSCILSCSFTDDQVSLWLNLCQGMRTTDWLLKLLKSQMHTVGKEWGGGNPTSVSMADINNQSQNSHLCLKPILQIWETAQDNHYFQISGDHSVLSLWLRAGPFHKRKQKARKETWPPSLQLACVSQPRLGLMYSNFQSCALPWREIVIAPLTSLEMHPTYLIK